MKQKVKPPNYWTKERCREAALKCKYRNEFMKKHSGAYSACRTNNWLDEVCNHMKQKVREPKWTKENCREAALKCKYRIEFSKKYKGAYSACYKNKWMDEVCSHMEQRIKHYYWTKERCKEVALKCKYRSEFKEKHKSAYEKCRTNNWMDEVCNHMKQKVRSGPYKWTKENCKQAALKCKYRSDFEKKHSGAYNVCLKNNWMDEVCSHMNQKIKHYYWTKENCKQAALECKSRSEFGEKHKSAYEKCRTNKWLDEVCNHMKQKIKPANYWTKENCREDALKCKSRIEFKEKHSGAYNACYKNGWLDELCSHMNITNKSVDGGIL